VTEGAVSQWFKKATMQGGEALRHQPPPGAHPNVRPQPRAPLAALLAKGAEAFGFRGPVWSTERVAQMMQQPFGVRDHPAHGSRLLRASKERPHKPIQRASQGDEAAIQAWKEPRWDERKTRPEMRRVPSFVQIRPLVPWCQWQ
jgi:transposase